MRDDLIAIKPSSERDPDGSKFRDVLRAHLALERARFTRVSLVHLMAMLGVPVWLVSLRPQWVSPGNRTLVLTAWALTALVSAVALAAEWRWRWRRDSHAAGLRDDIPPGQ